MYQETTIFFIGVSINLNEQIAINNVDIIAIITERFSAPSLLISLIIIIPILLCNKYHEKDIKPIFEMRLSLKFNFNLRTNQIKKTIRINGNS